MDQVLQWLDAGLHVVLVGFFALIPGILFWLGVLGIGLLVQNLKRYSLFRSSRIGSESPLAHLPSRTG